MCAQEEFVETIGTYIVINVLKCFVTVCVNLIESVIIGYIIVLKIQTFKFVYLLTIKSYPIRPIS